MLIGGQTDILRGIPSRVREGELFPSDGRGTSFPLLKREKTDTLTPPQHTTLAPTLGGRRGKGRGGGKGGCSGREATADRGQYKRDQGERRLGGGQQEGAHKGNGHSGRRWKRRGGRKSRGEEVAGA